MKKWSGRQWAFMCESFFRHQSYVLTVRAFRNKFNLQPRDSIPSRNSLKLCRLWWNYISVQKSLPIANDLFKRCRTPTPLNQNPMRSDRKYAVPLNETIFRDMNIEKRSYLVETGIMKLLFLISRKLIRGKISKKHLLIE